MGWMSPQQLFDDPKRWLNIPHEHHEVLLQLQEKLFPGFGKKLEEHKVHCLECEGIKPFEVIVKDTLKVTTCNGYIGDPRNVQLLNVKEDGDD